MKKFPLLLLAFTLAGSVLGQVQESQVSRATRQYREYRIADTTPTYGLRKVNSLIKRIKPDKEDNNRLSTATFNSLSVPEKFTFCMLHGEDMSQNCEGMPWVIDEEKKIFGHFPGIFGYDAVWSERQRAFLKSHRSSVIGLIRSTIKAHHRVGVNLKDTIVELNAVELIPDIVAVYNRDHRDQDILSVLMLLMKEGKFKPFMESATYKKLYSDDANWQASIEASAANEKLTVDRAMAFYKSRGK